MTRVGTGGLVTLLCHERFAANQNIAMAYRYVVHQRWEASKAQLLELESILKNGLL